VRFLAGGNGEGLRLQHREAASDPNLVILLRERCLAIMLHGAQHVEPGHNRITEAGDFLSA